MARPMMRYKAVVALSRPRRAPEPAAAAVAYAPVRVLCESSSSTGRAGAPVRPARAPRQVGVVRC
eukprot:6157385-Prymnesium_polylepis.1